MHDLLDLMRSFAAGGCDTDTFCSAAMDLYYNGRVFETAPRDLVPHLEQCMLAIGLTNDSPDRDPYGPELSGEGLRHIIQDYLVSIDGQETGDTR